MVRNNTYGLIGGQTTINMAKKIQYLEKWVTMSYWWVTNKIGSQLQFGTVLIIVNY